MCVVSMVGDHYHDKWKDFQWPQSWPQTITTTGGLGNYNPISRREFEDLKKEVEEMKKLLERAIEYDKKNNEPECQIEDKLETLKKIAELVGVDLTDILK